MRKKGILEGRKSRGSTRTLKKLCSLLIAALLTEGMPSGTIVSTYAAQHDRMETVVEVYTGKDGDLAAKGFIYTGQAAEPKEDGGEPTGEDNDQSPEDVTPTPAKKPKKTPTPMPEDTELDEEKDKPSQENNEKDNSSKDDNDADEEREPSQEDNDNSDNNDSDETDNDNNSDKTDDDSSGNDSDRDDNNDRTDDKDNNSDKTDDDREDNIDNDNDNSDNGSEDNNDNEKNDPENTDTPAPTKRPRKTPTPTPDGELGEEGDESGGDEIPAEPQTPTPTPTPTPTKAPAKVWPVNVPTQSDDARYQYLLGIDSRVITIDAPPAGYRSAAEAAKNMKTITVPVWKMTASGGRYASSMQLTINKKLARNVQEIFKEIYALELKFPIKVLKGFMYRKVGGVALSKSRIMSIHSFGAAIDINPGDYDNDYYLGKGNDLRDKSNPYCIPDEVIAIFEKHGWFWGGNFEICADTMHFQYFELGMLTYQDNWPFRHLKVKSGYMAGADVRNLQQRLRELGFSVSVDGVYGNKTADAIKRYQKSRGLEATGEMDYKTWETIINETHYMSYAF